MMGSAGLGLKAIVSQPPTVKPVGAQKRVMEALLPPTRTVDADICAQEGKCVAHNEQCALPRRRKPNATHLGSTESTHV